MSWEHKPELAGTLKAGDFDGEVILTFEDGSLVHFQYAFARQEGEFLVVYTEHCGYHAFFYKGLRVYYEAAQV